MHGYSPIERLLPMHMASAPKASSMDCKAAAGTPSPAVAVATKSSRTPLQTAGPTSSPTAPRKAFSIAKAPGTLPQLDEPIHGMQISAFGRSAPSDRFPEVQQHAHAVLSVVIESDSQTPQMTAIWTLVKRSGRCLFILSIMALLLTAFACDATTGPSIEFVTGAAADSAISSIAESELASARLGFVDDDGNAVAMENGARVPIGQDKVAEIFLSPYPPDWNTDLHLFLLDSSDFEPVQEVEVDLEYDMVWMDHGIDAQPGVKLEDGHYMMPLAFLMYGDWTVDVRLDFPGEGVKGL
ncbi:MAG: hypothetical protein QF368_10530 [SAR202 cluster bacterium]|nr:hypothetical protein [SAR202 cluster bacterium]